MSETGDIFKQLVLSDKQSTTQQFTSIEDKEHVLEAGAIFA